MHLQGARVLIVEDDGLVAMAANDMVKWLGGIVAGTARSVAAAKEKIRQPALDCVMLDVNLNGDLSLCIATELQERGIPFVFCTAYSHAFDGFEHVPRVVNPTASVIWSQRSTQCLYGAKHLKLPSGVKKYGDVK